VLGGVNVDDHIVNRRRRHLEVALRVGFGWRAAIQFRLRHNEREVLALKLREFPRRARPALTHSSRTRRNGEMDKLTEFAIRPIGRVHSTLKDRAGAPKQGREGAPDARVEVLPAFTQALSRLEIGQEIVLLTWLHQSRRDVLEVHPRGDRSNPLTGVFATRSPDRPNPIGLHRVTVLAIENERWLHVRPLEAIDGTPVVDIKPVLDESNDS
jgi:tRNA-Thr(GGU) m(6)t(6)A37 methyltransferase TsaA